MAFNASNWGVLTSAGNTQVNLQDGTIIGAPAIFSYQSATETSAAISIANYFSPVSDRLSVNDLIWISASDASQWWEVLAVDKNAATVTIGQNVGLGDVTGPAGATDKALVRWNGATGKLIQNGVVIESDLGDLSAVRTIAIAAGTIALPSYTFTGDLDTGLWHSAANTLDFSTNGLRALQIASSPAVSVDYLVVTASATNAANAALQPTISGTGTDAVVDVAVSGKGATGGLSILPTSTGAAGSAKFWNPAGTFFAKFQAGAMAASVTWTYPLVDGAAGQVLTTSGAGVLSWTNNAAGTWISSAATPVAMVANTGYINNVVAAATFNIPAAAAVGDEFELAGNGAGGWTIQMNAGQTANFNGTPTTVAGSLASTNRYNCIKLLCTVANTTFTVINSMGIITVA